MIQIESGENMKEDVILKIISIILVLVTIFAIICAFTIRGSGFLDVSNIARIVCIAIASVCGIFAVITWKYSKNVKQLKAKVFLVVSLIFAILTFIGGYLVITHKLDNAGYSVIPMLFTLIFSILYRNSKKEENNK